MAYGNDIHRWRWGQAHPALSQHKPFGRVAALAPLFDVSRPTGGDAWTVNVGQYWPNEADMPFANRHAASLRALYDLADMERRSPLNHVDRIVTPLLVIQGANDPRVTKQESDQIVAALRGRGVDVEYICKEGEGHGFAKPENRMEAYGAMERFFAKHLGGRIGDD